MEETVRQSRRSSKALDEAIMQGLEKLIPEYGFSNLQLSTLIKESGVDYNFFYRNYEVMENLYDKFIHKYDFWLSDRVDLRQAREMGERKFLISLFRNLYTELEENEVMQKILIWELEDVSNTTREFATLRENINMGLIAYYEEIFKQSKIDISATSTILLGGLYYIVLHRKVSRMCGIDYNNKKGKEKALQAIEVIINMLFDRLEAEKKLEKTVRLMAEDGIVNEKIAQYCDISESMVTELLNAK